jgi:hypothetical protein
MKGSHYSTDWRRADGTSLCARNADCLKKGNTHTQRHANSPMPMLSPHRPIRHSSVHALSFASIWYTNKKYKY